MTAGPSITDWISAVSTAALGVLGIFITAWQWRRTGFSPRLKSRIDARGEAIELLITNNGRAAGIIDQIDVLTSDNEVFDAEFEGFRQRAFKPLALPATATARIIIQAARGQPFPSAVRLLVGVGARRPKTVKPVVMAPEIGLFGLNSLLPPGANIASDVDRSARLSDRHVPNWLIRSAARHSQQGK